MLGAGPDVRDKSLEPIVVLPYLSCPTAVKTSKGKCFEK